MTSDARNGVLIPFDLALGDAIRLFPFGSRGPTFFSKRLYFGLLSVLPAVCYRLHHRRKLLLGPGAQAPPTFMIMGLAYMTSPPTFVT